MIRRNECRDIAPLREIKCEAIESAQLMRATAAWLHRNHPGEDTHQQATLLLRHAQRLVKLSRRLPVGSNKV